MQGFEFDIISRYVLAILIVFGYIIGAFIMNIRRTRNNPANRPRQNSSPEWRRHKKEEVRQPAQEHGTGSLIDINCATEKELATLPGLTAETAKTAYFVQQNGGFDSLSDFTKRLNISTPINELSVRAYCAPLLRGHSVGRMLDI